MKKAFFTGLALLMPVIITTIIVVFIVNLLTNPLLNIVSQQLDAHDLFNKPFLFLTGKQVLAVMSKLIILVSLVLFTALIGLIGSWFFVHYFVKFSEFFIHRIPFVNKIYISTQDIVKTIFGDEKSNFSAVVLVPFPHANARSIGLITNEKSKEGSDQDLEDMVSVLVPGTPNPAMGFMLLFKRDQLTLIDMTVQEAVKFVVSCGVIGPAVPEDTIIE